jgi:hypothetical protein
MLSYNEHSSLFHLGIDDEAKKFIVLVPGGLGRNFPAVYLQRPRSLPFESTPRLEIQIRRKL